MAPAGPIVVWGELLWDRFPDGARLGGAPANVAWHLGQRAITGGRRGPAPLLVTRVGADADGDEAVRRLARFVDPALIQRDPDRATGEVMVSTDAAGEPRYRLVPGRAWEHIALTAEAAAAIAVAPALVYGTLAQRTPGGLASWQAALALASPGCLRVCDPNLRPGRFDHAAVAAALAVADVVKVGDRELAALGRELGWVDPLATLRARCRLVAVTHGAAGSTLYPADGAPVPIAAVAAVPGGDAVGCGDAYLAVLLDALLAGAALADAGAVASAWAAMVAGHVGATPIVTMTYIPVI